MIPFDSPPNEPHERRYRPNKVLAQIDNLHKQGTKVQLFYWTNYSEGECLDFRTIVEN